MLAGDRYNRTIAVVGGGAAGLMAAAAAGHAGCRVLLFERGDRPGRKIYATGNGRCNLSNYAMLDDAFNVPILHRIRSFDERALMAHFERLGVYLHDRDGYVYPRTDQAATVVDAMLRDVQSCNSVAMHLGERVITIAKYDQQDAAPYFRVTSQQGDYDVDRVILAVGGQVNASFGCTGDGYRLAQALGHHVTTLSPALTPVMIQDPSIKIASGVRCYAKITAYTDGVCHEDTGELQITDKGFSGIPTFQVSRWLSQALAKGKDAGISIDFLPEFSEQQLREEIRRRQKSVNVICVRDVFAGLVNSKIGSYISRCNQLADEKKLANLQSRDTVIEGLLRQLRERRFVVTGTAGYDKAQVTAGGIPIDEVDEAFCSRKTPGLYLAGELLDVDGICGGYNLTFAMCSGYIAGNHAATAGNIT